jgi:hypothetical protein
MMGRLAQRIGDGRIEGTEDRARIRPGPSGLMTGRASLVWLAWKSLFP